MIKAHPVIMGVLQGFSKYVEDAEPVKSKRPKLRLNIKDTVTSGYQGIKLDRSESSEPGRVIIPELSVEVDKKIHLLHKRTIKVSNTVGIFHEGDFEAERDVAKLVEGIIANLITELAIVGAITAANNKRYNEGEQ